MLLCTHGIFDIIIGNPFSASYITCVFMVLCYFVGAAEDQAASRMKKEKYKQDLLKQIVEQQRRKSL